MNKINTNDGEIYANCMKEVKQRLAMIGRPIAKNYLDGIFYLEFSCLQMRKICELFSFATLIANRKLYEKIQKDFHKNWNFKRILNVVEKINPKYFPEPLKLTKNRHSKKNIFEGIKNDFLLRKNIEKIYSECCDYVHAQNHYKDLKNFYPKNYKEFLPWQKKLIDWKNKFIKLLNCHVIGIKCKEHTQIFITFMYMENINKKVEVITAK